jgi:glycine dehydrogenase subunit 1
MQAWFEFTSQLGELLDMEFVGLPVYSFGAAVGHAMRMASRVTGRSSVIIPEILDLERMAVIKTYAGHPELDGYLDLITCPCDPSTGLMDTRILETLVSDHVAAIYFESPTALGTLDTQGSQLVQLARAHGALSIMGVDPITLGVIRSPGSLDCDISVGSIASLGVHLNSGGGVAGFIASRDEEQIVRQFPTLQVSLADTTVEGELGFALTLFEQSSYAAREEGNDWTGNGVYLWAIAASVYMSLLGPEGFREIGAAVLQRTFDLKRALSSVDGVEVLSTGSNFREIVVSFRDSGKSVKSINDYLLGKGIFGGRDLSQVDSRLDGCALYCVTEVHTHKDIEDLVQALQESLS